MHYSLRIPTTASLTMNTITLPEFLTFPLHLKPSANMSEQTHIPLTCQRHLYDIQQILFSCISNKTWKCIHQSWEHKGSNFESKKYKTFLKSSSSVISRLSQILFSHFHLWRIIIIKHRHRQNATSHHSFFASLTIATSLTFITR